MFFIKDAWATIWKVEDKGKYSNVSMSTSRKDEDGKTYINSSWWANFVGKAHNKLDKHEITDRTRIIIKTCKIAKEPYMKDGEKMYPKNASITVFDFELQDDKTPVGKMDTAPAVQEEPEDNDIPF